MDYSNKYTDIINSPSPVATEIQIHESCFDIIKNSITPIKLSTFEEMIQGYSIETYPTLYGIKVKVVENNDGFQSNQGKVIYNNGSFKIIDMLR